MASLSDLWCRFVGHAWSDWWPMGGGWYSHRRCMTCRQLDERSNIVITADLTQLSEAMVRLNRAMGEFGAIMADGIQEGLSRAYDAESRRQLEAFMDRRPYARGGIVEPGRTYLVGEQ